MTPRALFLGLTCAALLAGVVYYNDYVIKQSFLIGNFLPMGVYGVLALFLVLVNPLLRRIGPNWALRGREIVVVLALVFAVCGIPSSGLLRNFTAMLMLPHQHERTEPGWKEAGIVEKAPDIMLADPGPEGEALGGMLQGLSPTGELIGPGEIPWDAWSVTLGFWVPILVAFWIGITALALVVHRQWSDHEHLPYPLATLTNSLLPDQPGRLAPIFLNRLFVIATAGVFIIHLSNYLQSFNPDLIAIKRNFDFRSLLDNLPATFRNAAALTAPLNFQLYFTAIGIAYFLSREVSLSVGLAPFAWASLAGLFALYGVDVTGETVNDPENYFRGGAILGLLGMILFTGRVFYRDALLSALRPGARSHVEPGVVWAMRVFLVCMIALFTLFLRTGLDWQLILILMLGVVATYVVMSRILAETGLIMIQPRWSPAILMTGLLGGQALGPETIIIMSIITAVFLMDPREAFMPFVVQALKLVEMRQVKVAPVVPWIGGAALLGFGVALPITLLWQYTGGFAYIDPWTSGNAGRLPFTDALLVQQQLEAQGALAQAESISGWARFTLGAGDRVAWISFIIGIVLTVGCAWLRLRFIRWPIHPLIFVIWFGWASTVFAISFLIGFLIKALVTKYAGEKIYQKLKPMMIGLVFGEILAGITAIVCNLILYAATGQPPERFMVLPG
ncbi:MAG: DUF6785 family protein [Opitutales bacterium]